MNLEVLMKTEKEIICPLCHKKISRGEKICEYKGKVCHKKCREREKTFRFWEFLTAMEE